MKWLKTFSLVVRSNVTSLFEYFENPERVLHQLILDMEEELENVKSRVANVFADEIQLGRQGERAREEAKQWEQRAGQALRRGDEIAARSALEQKIELDARAEGLEVEHQKQKAETAKLHRAVRDLEQKMRMVRQRRSLLAARLARVESSQNINSIIKRVDGTSALAHFQRLEARVDREEALEAAHERLDGRDPDAAELALRFEEEERKERLQREYDELKDRLSEER